MQSKIDKVAVVDAFGVAFVEGADAAPGGLADGQLLLVDEANDVVGVRHLWYLNLEFQAAVVVEPHRLARLMVAAFVVAQLSVASMAVGHVCDHRAAVYACPPAADEVGASIYYVR